MAVGSYSRALLYVLTYAAHPLKRTSLMCLKSVRLISYVWNKSAGQVADDVLRMEEEAYKGKVRHYPKVPPTQGSLFKK